ncbi:MAG TPA: ATP-dependent sacrificial sulfur transferase LarE [Thermodesulfobacteriota bacterium]|nr:ATP-dependent sacrificial sulfur transferase LarE [Deltaproteobacteria bacterium]HNR14722.1 ATP-dependent sacrificial sulfur transferase LarE [Thermodesulfobacteriota bacterium]HNU72230.1 ATP-dependent sacrificial sulfur transferase LarE [Thermodesulfobacteriota bacterium]HOC39148.1 ATP-dependent sacrificial sulfur transferase LarE [Thermodesulfobacteriota bacterium]
MSSDCLEKYARLKHILQEMRRVLVAYSGGVDSTFLLHSAVQALGAENTIAVIARSPLRSAAEHADAIALTRSLGVVCMALDIDELSDPKVAGNSPDRCYHCKRKLFSQLREVAHIQEITWIIEGSNADDAAQYRPGKKALQELGIRSPLAEAQLTKNEVRRLSQEQGLPTWDKPANACFATRIPYGEPLSLQVLSMIEQGENFLHEEGFELIRIRSYRGLARIEVLPDEIERFLKSDLRTRVIQKLKELGFRYICLDLEGYRSGSMDEVLPDAILRAG